MTIEIKKLTPELTDMYLDFFDNTEHYEDGYKCYCVGWGSAKHSGEDFLVEANRRGAVSEYISKGYLQGYLAFSGGKIIGWCNANNKTDCFDCLYGQMYMGDIKRESAMVKSVFCFVVAPHMRKKGIAKLLLSHIIKDATNDGYDYIEVYPNKEFLSEAYDYMGPRKMYEDLGFAYAYDMEPKIVMRKKLK